MIAIRHFFALPASAPADNRPRWRSRWRHWVRRLRRMGSQALVPEVGMALALSLALGAGVVAARPSAEVAVGVPMAEAGALSNRNAAGAATHALAVQAARMR